MICDRSPVFNSETNNGGGGGGGGGNYICFVIDIKYDS